MAPGVIGHGRLIKKTVVFQKVAGVGPYFETVS